MLKFLRKLFFWAHLIAGCVGGLVILLMSLTGVLLMYERQILAWKERGPYLLNEQAPGPGRLPIEDVLLQAGVKGTPTITIRSASNEPLELNLGPKGIVYVNPSTGGTLGKPEKSTREFFQSLRGWHRWIALEGDKRPVGKAITGACTLAFVFLVVSGLYIWLPRGFSWQYLRPIVWFRGGLSGKARDFNWHNAIGIWCAVPLFFVAISALPISYPWANRLIYDLTGTEMPKADNTPAPKGEWVRDGIDRVVETAKSQAGWRSISFRLGADFSPVLVTVDRGDGGQPQLRSTLLIDRASGTVLKEETFESFNTGRRIRSFSRFLHTGESLGLVGQTIAGIASLGGVVLVWTGIALALRRWIAWRKRQATSVAARA
jgi:uncharacterized iron-regulated membrane protein